tara:strand:+ start:3262 stop:3642 length:381 start_codon:yes stop_codon:yes gene_type:complete
MNSKSDNNDRYSESYKTNLFDKEVWGPKLWEVMHTFSFAYPTEPTIDKKNSAIKFFSSIGHLIPCTHCSKHCLEYTQRNPPNVSNKQTLIDWVYNFHNEVNKRLGKPHYSKQELKNKYDEVAFCKS